MINVSTLFRFSGVTFFSNLNFWGSRFKISAAVFSIVLRRTSPAMDDSVVKKRCLRQSLPVVPDVGFSHIFGKKNRSEDRSVYVNKRFGRKLLKRSDTDLQLKFLMLNKRELIEYHQSSKLVEKTRTQDYSFPTV